MTRNFGIMSRQPSPWGHSGERPPAYDASTRVDSIPLPAASILTIGPAFKRSRLTQSLIDVLALGSLALLVCSLATAVGIFGYVLYLKFFV